MKKLIHIYMIFAIAIFCVSGCCCSSDEQQIEHHQYEQHQHNHQHPGKDTLHEEDIMSDELEYY